MADNPNDKKPSAKARAWPLFDAIIEYALSADGEYSNPWITGSQGLAYVPDYRTLERLLGVPLYLKAATTTGVPALALDVWLAYELRRAGFAPDAVWPRATHPRILPGAIVALLEALPKKEAETLRRRLERKGAVRGVTAASASILGKNYNKQVDVIMADWSTGPELLISTKRMDSSYGKNAPNRVEESYGDAKNLRLRHPLAALGFVFGLRSDVFEDEPETAAWLLDLLVKLGREEDAYHATCAVLMEYDDEPQLISDDSAEPDDSLLSAPGVQGDRDDDEFKSANEYVEPASEPSPLETILDLGSLPRVRVDLERTPDELSPARFLRKMVNQVIEATPVNMHVEARRRRLDPRPVSTPEFFEA